MTPLTARLVDKYAAVLAEEGFHAVLDAEGDLYFRVDGGHYFLRVGEGEAVSFVLLYPNFHAVKSEADRKRAHAAASEVNACTKMVKVFLTGGDTQASVEVLLASEGDFRAVFARALAHLRAGVGRFREIVRERAEWPQACLKA